MSVLEIVGRVVFGAYMLAVMPAMIGVLSGRWTIEGPPWRGIGRLLVGIETWRYVRFLLDEQPRRPYLPARCTCCPIHGPERVTIADLEAKVAAMRNGTSR